MTAYSYPERIQQFITNNPGTGNIVLGAAQAGFAALGASDDAHIFESVLIIDGNNWEVRSDCIYTHGTLLLTRGTFIASSIGSAISFTASAQIAIGLSGAGHSKRPSLDATRKILQDPTTGAAVVVASSNLTNAVANYPTLSGFPTTPTGDVAKAIFIDNTTGIAYRWSGSGYVNLSIPVDSNGNFVANVVPRTGTLAFLLGISTAGDGEIASATDVDAIVKYKGTSPSVGTAFFRSKIASEVVFSVPIFTCGAINTFTTVSLASAVLITSDPFGVLSTGTNSIVVPAGGYGATVEVLLPWAEQTGASGSRRGFRMFSGVTITPSIRWFAANIAATGVLSNCNKGDYDLGTVSGSFQIQLNHDSSVAPNVGLSSVTMQVTVKVYLP